MFCVENKQVKFSTVVCVRERTATIFLNVILNSRFPSAGHRYNIAIQTKGLANIVQTVWTRMRLLLDNSLAQPKVFVALWNRARRTMIGVQTVFSGTKISNSRETAELIICLWRKGRLPQ